MKEYKLPIGCDVPETIILADGDFPSHPLALEWLRQCPYVVCCDGAANTYIRSGRMPEAIVGDGDSLLPGIFNMNSTVLFAEGLAYPLSVFTNWWQGTLNEALAKHFIIRTEGKVLVFRTF
ncbi:motility associated factor glycosyltransferase family protein [Phocaeicola dorei]|uniref:hypothetical protein n=1 Tax=Phocaeicola dorei TaxID=357276 RepID=UPI00101DA2C6|nr:hypothetical protein [Phocaeicola dorei]